MSSDRIAEAFVARVREYLARGYPLRSYRRETPSALRLARADFGISRWTANDLWKKYGFEEELHDEPLPESSAEKLEIERLRALCNDLGIRIRELEKRNHELERRCERLLSLRDLDVGRAELSIGHDDAGREEIAVLFTSDFQWGEVIDPEVMDGYNAYNVEIASRRYDTLISKTLDICGAAGIRRIVVLRGGDSFSGTIHDELTITNDATTHDCFKSLAAKEIAGLEALCDRFEKVDVVSVPGNHSLSVGNTRFKKYVDVNYDDLLSWFLAMYFSAKGTGNIEFVTSRSGDVLFDIFGWTFVLTHGDRVGARGGTGFLGPVAIVQRGILNVLKQYSAIGKKVDWVLMGHYHVPMILPKGVVNGTLAGYNEYARFAIRAEPQPPSQWLFFVHPDYGISRWYLLFVDGAGPCST